MAESQFKTGTGALSAQARVDFQITVPKVLYLRVGTGNALGAADNTTIDLIDFTVTGANVGSGTAVSGTGGDQGGGKVTARVISNGGDVTLTSATAGAMNNGTAAETISWSKINTTAAVLTSATALPAPALADTGTTSTTVAATNKIVNRDAVWTYTYANDTVPAAGVYGGAGTATAGKNNGRATYTASIL